VIGSPVFLYPYTRFVIFSHSKESFRRPSAKRHRVNEQVDLVADDYHQFEKIPRSIWAAQQIPFRVVIQFHPHNAILNPVKHVFVRHLVFAGTRQDLHLIKCTTNIRTRIRDRVLIVLWTHKSLVGPAGSKSGVLEGNFHQ
jgi:hypothetical protein